MQVFRKIPICLKVSLSPSERRVFLFKLSVGFRGPIDPQTGMSIDIGLVDKWLVELKVLAERKNIESFEVSWNSFYYSLLGMVKNYLNEKSSAVGVELRSILLEEVRNLSLVWQSQSHHNGCSILYSHFLEDINFEGRPDLMKVLLSWKLENGESADFHKLGIELLKSIDLSAQDSYFMQMKNVKNETIQKHLESCEIHFMSDDYILTEKFFS